MEQRSPHVPWRNRPNVLVLSYAQMKVDPAAVRRIAALMGCELSDAQLAQVLEKSSFAAMKQIDKKFAPVSPFPFNHLLGKPVMIRKGEGGASAELLSPAQQAQIDSAMLADLARLGSDFPYAELFCQVACRVLHGSSGRRAGRRPQRGACLWRAHATSSRP